MVTMQSCSNNNIAKIPGLKPYTVSKNCAFDLSGSKGKLGLYVKNGKVMYKGKEFKGMGVDYYDGFIQLIETGNITDNTYAKNFKKLRGNNIPYIRISFSQYWPVLYKKYAENKKQYFEAMDSVVKAAEENGIGIIATLFWSPRGTSDYCDEPYNAWGDADSKTRAFMAEYVKEVVGRYKNSPAIWGWEFANELNLDCDLPNAADLIGSTINKEMGTRATRDENDYMHTPIMAKAMTAFAAEVRKYDKVRLISSGNAAPRPSAYNMLNYTTWDLDTSDQLASILGTQNPAQLEAVSAHIYTDENRYDSELSTIEGLIEALNNASIKMNRPLFIGEYGGDITGFGLDAVKSQFRRVFDSVVKNKVPLSCVWGAWSNSSKSTDNILQNPDLSFILKELNKQNVKDFNEAGIEIWK